MEADITGAEQLKIVVSNWGDGFAYDRADLINPVLVDANGNETSLTTLKQSSYQSEWGSLHVNENVEGQTLKVEGQSYTTGLGLNAQCTLIYDLPEGHNYKTFRALCGYDSSCDSDNGSSSGTTMEFIFYVTKKEAFTFDLTQLGYAADAAQTIPVYDIWAKEDVGYAVNATLTTTVPSHGVKLFRLGEKATTGIQDVKKGQATNVSPANGLIYNLQGQRVGANWKGIQVQNGKKRIKR
jgi:hypothetical protein